MAKIFYEPSGNECELFEKAWKNNLPLLIKGPTGCGKTRFVSYMADQFSDYILGQNDYTLSNGDHVKVPNSYDYVYEGTDGNVYVSGSSFDQPAGSTQLYPN